MIQLREKIVFTMVMSSFALAAWMSARPADRRYLPAWLQGLIPRILLRNGRLGRQTQAILYILFFFDLDPSGLDVSITAVIIAGQIDSQFCGLNCTKPAHRRQTIPAYLPIIKRYIENY